MEYLRKRTGRLDFEPESWYGVTREEFLENDGYYILLIHNDSFYQLLTTLFPAQKKFLPWKFSRTPARVFADKSVQLWYLQWFAETVLKLPQEIYSDFVRLGNPDIWYGVTLEQFQENDGSVLLLQYGFSPYKMFASLFPNSEFMPWKFSKTPNAFWNSIENQKRYMKWLSKVLSRNLETAEDWYDINAEDFLRNFGGYLLSKYGSSPYQLLSKLFPETEWLPWCFTRAPGGFWESESNQRTYLKWLFQELHFSKEEDWYRITKADFEKHFGTHLLLLYNGSPSRIIMHLLNSEKVDEEVEMEEEKVGKGIEYRPWMFNRAPYNMGKSEEEMKALLQYVFLELGLKQVRRSFTSFSLFSLIPMLFLLLSILFLCFDITLSFSNDPLVFCNSSMIFTA